MNREGKPKALVAAAAVASLLLVAPAASGSERGTVRGQILDSTCFGPCVAGQEPARYEGEATVVVTRLPKRRVVERFGPESDGSFEVKLAPGRYKIKIRIEDPCYIEDKRLLTLSPGGDIDGPEFFVSNDCIR